MTEKNLPKLAFLRTNKALFENMDSVAELKDLKMLCLQEAMAQLTDLKYLMIESSEKMTGLSSVLELPKLYGAYMVTGSLTSAGDDVREMVEACRSSREFWRSKRSGTGTTAPRVHLMLDFLRAEFYTRNSGHPDGRIAWKGVKK